MSRSMKCSLPRSPMRKVSDVILGAVVCFTICTSLFANSGDAIVKIYATRDGNAGQGTGFFSNTSGQVVTAYHVIEGADRIEVVSESYGVFPKIRVDFISPEYDLAILQILNLQILNPDIETQYLNLTTRLPLPSQELEIIAFPLGNILGHYTCRVTRSDYVSSATMRTKRGARLFSRNIDLLSIDATIYQGMSGAPVISQEGVIGIISGSYDEGGSIGWIIPCKYVSEVSKVFKMPGEMQSWPELALMSNNWNNLRGNLSVNTALVSELDRFLGAAEYVAEQYNGLTSISVKLLGELKVMRLLMSNLRNYPEKMSDKDQIENVLDYPLNQIMESLGKFSEYSYQHGEAKMRLAQLLANLDNLLINEGDLNIDEIKLWNHGLNNITFKYRDIKQGYWAATNFDEESMGQMLMEFSQLVNEDSVEGFLTTLSRGIDSLEPMIQSHCSVEALQYISREMSQWRSVGALFEGIVYGGVTWETLSRKYAEYESVKYRYRIRLPESWTKQEDPDQSVVLIARSYQESQMDNVRENITVTSTSVYGLSYQTVDQYYPDLLKLIQQTMTGFSLVSEGRSIINGLVSQWAIYTLNINGMALMQKVHVFISEDRAYSVTCTTTPQSFDTHKETFDTIVSSFRIVPK